MKNLFKGALVIMLIFIAPALHSKDIVNPAIAVDSKSPDAAETQKMIERLEEIKNMDVSKMSKKEKRALRKEVKATEKAMQSSGVYVSVGGLLLIILIVILLI